MTEKTLQADATRSGGRMPRRAGRRRLLVLAPHPFFQNRGTPIDVDLLLRVLSSRGDLAIDLLVYGEGQERSYPNVRLYRTPLNRFTRGVRPGFSPRKILTDVFFLAQAWTLVHQHRYDLIHAGEEAAFMARLFQALYGIPYIYDLDSSVAQQVVEKHDWLRPAAPLFDRLEARVIRDAMAAAPVCNALADLCRRAGARCVATLHDISQLRDPRGAAGGRLRRET
ncbi:MAG: glycosyltransferase, partial [Candidatus Eisenbacteria bacterium]|nr:glycosyltransferase [Candidatus Eisenbacteria bacterium]